MHPDRMPWADVAPLTDTNGSMRHVLEPVRSLQRAWRSVVSEDTAAFHEARRRSLRRHAIETGIIERLYDVDWGVTQALVAEGLTANAVAHAPDGHLSEDVLRVITTQYEALEFLAEVAREGRELSTSLIKEIHVALTRNQRTFTATAPTGGVFEATLHHGAWKGNDNSVTRPDGTILECTPWEQVPPQMERLVEFYQSYADVDPIVREAWLHHRFVRIHPFEDGNGRVARCLTLLGLLRADLAPLVVDRRERDRYLQELDRANQGDLQGLVQFFAELEIAALRREIEQPTAGAVDTGRGARATLEAGIDRLRGLKSTEGAAERAGRVAALAAALQERVDAWLRTWAADAQRLLQEGVDPRARAPVISAAPPDERAWYWHRQVVETAKSVDFYANTRDGVWWSRLHLTAHKQTLRYLVFLQKVGHGETGVLTLTTYAEMLGATSEDDGPTPPQRVMVSSPTATVTWAHTDTADAQWDSVDHVLDATLAQALDQFMSALG